MSIELNQTILVTASSIIAVFMATTMIFVRMKAAQKPTSTKKIILPPIFMSSGACMYLIPEFRLTGLEIIEAVIAGALFSILLIKNTKFEIKQDDIFLIPSKSFIFILVGLLIVRTVIKVIVGSTISLGETSGMFYLLALAMIVTWRLFMLKKYKKLANELKKIKTYA